MDIFDIIGPVMIGPSSSHTAGAVRIGRVAWKVLGEKAVGAKIELSGSFAETYRGHGTDKAIIGGIMGLHSYDAGIRSALETAKKSGLDYEFVETQIPDAHPNTARISLLGESGAKCCVTASSIGGGNIRVNEINGQQVDFTGQLNTLIVIHRDVAGAIADVTNYIANARINIGSFRLSRAEKGGEAVMTIEVDDDISEQIVRGIEAISTVTKVIMIRKI